MSDDLIDRVRRHDREALGEFLTERRRPLIAFIDRQLGGALRRKVEVDDIYQEVCAEAVRALDDVELGDRDPFSWLCQLAERRIIDAHRRFFASQKRDAAREVGLGAPGGSTSRAGLLNLLVASMTSPSAAFSRDQRHLRMLAALDQLPADQREALRMRYLEGLPSKEIAEKLGKSDGSIRVMLTRALKRLQTMLGEG